MTTVHSQGSQVYNSHLFALAAFMGDDPEPCLQGFIASGGQFVDRASARKLAEHGGQLREGAAQSSDLFSEDVW